MFHHLSTSDSSGQLTQSLVMLKQLLGNVDFASGISWNSRGHIAQINLFCDFLNLLDIDIR